MIFSKCHTSSPFSASTCILYYSIVSKNVACGDTMSTFLRNPIHDSVTAFVLLNFVTAWLEYEIAPNSIDVNEAKMR